MMRNIILEHILYGGIVCLAVFCVMLDSVALATNARVKIRCPSDTYSDTADGPCKPCSVCGPGEGTLWSCTKETDTMCEPCGNWQDADYDDGYGYEYDLYDISTYSWRPSNDSLYRECVPCTICENRETLRTCTAEYDAKCGDCYEGFYWDQLTLTCKVCSRCYGDEGRRVMDCDTKDQPREYQCVPFNGTEPNPKQSKCPTPRRNDITAHDIKADSDIGSEPNTASPAQHSADCTDGAKSNISHLLQLLLAAVISAVTSSAVTVFLLKCYFQRSKKGQTRRQPDYSYGGNAIYRPCEVLMQPQSSSGATIDM